MDLEAALLEALIWAESGHNPKAVGPMTKYGTAKGLCQLLDSTGKEMHRRLKLPGEYDPFNADQNKTIGKAYLQQMSRQFDGDTRLALAAYNWGPGNLSRLIRRIGSNSFIVLKPHLPKETQAYVTKILRKRDQYLV